MAEADKTTRLLGAGTEVSYSILKDGKLRICVDVDEDKIVKAVLPKIVAFLSGDIAGEEKPAPKKRGPRKAKPGQPGYVSDHTAPIPFPDKNLKPADAAKE